MTKKLLIYSSFLFSGLFFAQETKISFETSEGYKLGLLDGQKNWEAWGEATDLAKVVNTKATDGSYSFNMDSTEEVQDWVGIETITQGLTGVKSEISFDYYFDGLEGSGYEIDIYKDNVDYDISAALLIDYEEGTLSLYDGEDVFEGPKLQPNKWYRFKIIFDKSNNSVEYFLDGQSLFKATIEDGVNPGVIDFTFDDFGSGFYVDNLKFINLDGLAVNDINKKNNISVYPNPAVDFVEVNTNDKSIKSIKLFDPSGKLVKSETINKKSAKVNVSNLAKGAYILNIETETGTESKKIIKK